MPKGTGSNAAAGGGGRGRAQPAAGAAGEALPQGEAPIQDPLYAYQLAVQQREAAARASERKAVAEMRAERAAQLTDKVQKAMAKDRAELERHTALRATAKDSAARKSHMDAAKKVQGRIEKRLRDIGIYDMGASGLREYDRTAKLANRKTRAR